MARSNRVAVPEAKQSLKNFKTEVANSMNITLNDGYNGDISARDAGRIGGFDAPCDLQREQAADPAAVEGEQARAAGWGGGRIHDGVFSNHSCRDGPAKVRRGARRRNPEGLSRFSGSFPRR